MKFQPAVRGVRIIETQHVNIDRTKMKAWLSKFFMIAVIAIIYATYANAGEISCRYYSDHNQQENMGAAADIVGIIADQFTGGAASAISGGATAVGIASSVNDHKIYCIYSEKGDNQENRNKIFYNLLKSKDVIPIFLYENLAQKKIEPCQLSDINTPFSSAGERDKTAKANEFVFKSKTAISDIKYFGFLQPKTNNIVMYSVNPKTLQLREPKYNQWKEIHEEYLK